VHYESPGDQAHDCGFEVPVTQALTGALRQFRARATESGEPLALWTDAVCINQRDTAERSQQVSRMRKVYRAAASVMIWLGEGDPVAETGLVNLFGLAMCRQAGNAERDHSLDAFDYSAYDATPDMENLERMNAILKIFGNRNSEPEIDEALSVYMTLWVQAVSTLLELPYWYRGWTFQEASSNENIVLHYGDSRCRVRRWDLVADVTNQDMKQLLFITQPERPHLLPLPNFLIWAYRVHTARFFAGLYNDPRWKFDLATIIACVKGEIGVLQSSSTQTTDPRDQIYSRIGSGPGFAHLKIEPDYSLTTEQVFIATTVAILQASQSWSHAYFFDTSRSPFMPSWSIDFTLPRDWESLFFDRPREASTRHTTDGSASFCLYEGQPGTLFTAGFIYDEIAIVEPRNQLESMMTVKKWILKFNSRLGHWHQSLGRTAMLTMGDPWEAICRVMCLGIVGKDKFESRHATACQRWLHEQVADDDMLPVLQSMNYMPKRKAMSIIITRNGRMGLARRDANVGDHIAILATGSMPFVLRKVRERDDNGCAYILLGACYVDSKTFTLRQLKIRHADTGSQISCTVKLFAKKQRTSMRQDGAATLISRCGSGSIAI